MLQTETHMSKSSSIEPKNERMSSSLLSPQCLRGRSISANRPIDTLRPAVGKPLHGPLENTCGKVTAADDVVELGAATKDKIGHGATISPSEPTEDFSRVDDLIPHVHVAINAYKYMHSQDINMRIPKISKSDNNEHMKNAIFERVQQRMTELGMTLNGVSDAAGLNRNYLRVTLARPNAVPRADTLEKLAHALQVTPEWLLRGQGRISEDEYERKSAAVAAMPPVSEWPVNIPVLGTAAGSLDRGAFQLGSGVIEHVRCPPGLIGKRDIYALYCVGTSMQPKYQGGDLILVNPHRPPTSGDVVVVQCQAEADGEIEATLGIYLRETEAALTLGKFNPPDKTVEIVRDRISKIHRVVTNNEMFGI